MREFWDFSLDELAVFDIPAMIDYILAVSKFETIVYGGFSQGTAVGFASISVYPRLNNKIEKFIALAATTVPRGLKHGIGATLIRASPEAIYFFFGRKSFISFAYFWSQCLSPDMYRLVIDYALEYFFGWKSKNMDIRTKQQAYQHLYGFTSVKQIVHWFQIIRSRRLQMYDDGPSIFSKSHVIPRYRLSKVSIPILMFYGEKDLLVDIGMTKLECRNSKNVEIVHIPHYEHLDFLWSKDLQITVIDKVIEWL